MTSEEKSLESMTLEEIKEAAGKKVKQDVWEWINGGTETELTLLRNRSQLEKILLKLSVLHGLEAVNTEAKMLGRTVRTPIIVAPFANMASVHPEAELALARGADKAGAIMFLGQVSSYATKQVVEAVNTPIVWNGEPLKDRKSLLSLMKEAGKAGCCAVGVCVDDFVGVKVKERLKPLRNAALSAKEIRELKKATALPLVVKGIMTIEDAIKAADAGADAIVVSNHGGRVLDCCQASIEVLPEIVKAVGAKIEVLVDGGFRRGTDVLKALALGAKGVLVGRPICWGLATAGAEGVARVIELMTNELYRAMMLTNVSDVSNVPRDCVILT
ncbi:MAG TPA: alpha-hydroxy-acid oxidizing protein [Syntrophorhabdales bacterium]|nr:alpha-hydroxy-acid oxidizing protein [Syntrophorhabdales bacterium]